MEEEVIYSPRMSPVTVRTNVSNEYLLRLTQPITDPDHFAEMFMALQAAQFEDRIRMDINSPGGSLDTCIMIRRAMAQCQASICGWVGPTCASAATAIALQCDEWEIDEMSTFMIHTGSFSPGYNTARNVAAATDHTVRQIETFIRSVYTGFLTEEEIELVLDNRELYFVGEELAERLVGFANYRESLYAEAQDEEEIPVDTDSVDE